MDSTSLTLRNYGYGFISTVALILFVIASVCEITFSALGIREVELALKALLVPLLLFNTLGIIFRDKGDRNAAVVVSLALVFHTIGDILMEFPEKMFLYAMGAFLVGHIVLQIYFIQRIGKQHFPGNMVWAISAVLSGLAALWISPERGMILPVIVYALVLLYYPACGICGLSEYSRSLRKGENISPLRKPAYLHVIFGGLLFIISDGLIGLSAFKGMSVPSFGVMVMATYLCAEFLLTRGLWKLSLCPPSEGEHARRKEREEEENFDE